MARAARAGAGMSRIWAIGHEVRSARTARVLVRDDRELRRMRRWTTEDVKTTVDNRERESMRGAVRGLSGVGGVEWSYTVC